MEEARHKIVTTLLFYLHKAQTQPKLTYAVRNQNIGCHYASGRKRNGSQGWREIMKMAFAYWIYSVP